MSNVDITYVAGQLYIVKVFDAFVFLDYSFPDREIWRRGRYVNK